MGVSTDMTFSAPVPLQPGIYVVFFSKSLSFGKMFICIFWEECFSLIDFVSPSRHSSLVEGGCVYIRDWRERKPFRADAKRKPVAPGALKTRLCWFHAHHPQGCPLQAENCAFAHGADDLRPSTRPLKKIKNDAF